MPTALDLDAFITAGGIGALLDVVQGKDAVKRNVQLALVLIAVLLRHGTFFCLPAPCATAQLLDCRSHPRLGTSSDAPRVVEQAMAGGPPILLVAVVGKFVDDDRVVALTIVLLERMCGKHGVLGSSSSSSS